MLKIAVYSEEKVMSPLLQEYMGIWQRDAGCVCAVRYYDNVHAIMVDMDLEGIYDVVVVYRSWDVADALKKDRRVGSLVMIAAGINRRLYDIQPCYILYEPVNAANFKKVMTMAVEGSRDERRFTFVSGRVRYSVDTRSIMYFESELRRINLVTTEQKYVFYGSIGEMEKRMKVGYGGFIRPHESYLVNPDHVSLSSDAYGSQPRFNDAGECVGLTYASPKYLHKTIRALVRMGMPLEQALKLLTTTPATLLAQDGRKGCIAAGADADLLVLDEELEIDSLFARGQLALWQKELRMKGRFEE